MASNPADMIEVEHPSQAGELWDWPLQGNNDGIVQIHNDSERFEVGLDCQYFSPKEIEIKVIGDEIVIHCRHELRSGEFGTVAREVHRAYRLPPDVDTRTIKSTLTQKGVLVINACKKSEDDY